MTRSLTRTFDRANALARSKCGRRPAAPGRLVKWAAVTVSVTVTAGLAALPAVAATVLVVLIVTRRPNSRPNAPRRMAGSAPPPRAHQQTGIAAQNGGSARIIRGPNDH